MRRKGRFLLALTGVAAGLLATQPVAAQEAEEATQQPATITRDVKIILFLIDLIEIEGAEQSFFADILLRAEWHDPELEGVYDATRTIETTDAWQPRLQIVNQLSVSRGLPEVLQVSADGMVRYVQRLTGRFSSPMNLRDFPLDSQEFSVQVISMPRYGETIALIPDTEIVNLSNAEMSITDWRLGEIRLESASFSGGPLGLEVPTAALTIGATRILRYYVIQILIPLVAIVLMGWTVFWIAPSVIATRVGVVVTTMLTLFAYRFMVADNVPRLSYLTRFDYFTLGATILVMLALFTMAGTAYLWGREQTDVVKRIDWIGRTLYPVVFAVYSAFVWLG